MIINIDLDIQYHRKQCSELLKNSKKISGFKKHNKFVKVNDLNYFKTWIENITDKKGLDWNFEYFHAENPLVYIQMMILFHGMIKHHVKYYKV